MVKRTRARRSTNIIYQFREAWHRFPRKTEKAKKNIFKNNSEQSGDESRESKRESKKLWWIWKIIFFSHLNSPLAIFAFQMSCQSHVNVKCSYGTCFGVAIALSEALDIYLQMSLAKCTVQITATMASKCLVNVSQTTC